MNVSSRRRSVPNRALVIQMALIVVLTPAFAIAAFAAVVIFLPRHLLVLLMVGVGISTLVRGVAHVSRKREPRVLLAPRDDPELFAIVDRLCAVVDLPRPEIVMSGQRQANSWVVHPLGKPPRLYLTRALRELLTLDELQAVLAHELTHIVNRDALVMTTVGMPGALMLSVRGGGIDGFLVSIIGLVSGIGTNTLSRHRELAADAGSAMITGRPSALASALLKVSDALHRIPDKDLRAAAALNAFNLVPVTRTHRWWHDIRPVMWLARTHPALPARVARLHDLEYRQHQPRG